LRGIREAKPYSDYDNLSNAGIMRSIEDYAMGINFSRALSVKYAGMINKEAGTKKYSAISVGRVMTCVLGMVVKREREIRNFKETFFYRVTGSFRSGDIIYKGEWKAVEGSKYYQSPLLYSEKGFKEEKDALILIDELKNAGDAKITALNKGTEKKKPPLLFNLAELQAECSKRFKISPDETLKSAQELYEKKLLTYPRTDARVLSTAVAKVIANNLKGLMNYTPTAAFTKNILDNSLFKGIEKSQYTNDKKVTDHYAIIPTGNLNELSGQSDLNKKVYDLVVRRFLSIFYPPAEFTKLSIVTGVGVESFFTNAKVLKSPGYFVITGQDKVKEKSAKDKEKKAEDEEGEGDDDEIVNDPKALMDLSENVKKGDAVDIVDFNTKNGKTSPPKRYTSGSMVLAMENAGQLIEDEELRSQITGSGIGTSATRAGIIEKLIKIGYLALNKKTQILTPKTFGEMVYEVVRLTIPSMLNPEMTASWEKGLSQVETGKITPEYYKETLNKYVTKYVESIRNNNLSANIRRNIDFLKS
ncbi:MAG: DNA topoisomerase III, partial [Lachnospiraceae bacterium]|nr:DNA topoisomerase III [Lachnospiraceae bacterium]